MLKNSGLICLAICILLALNVSVLCISPSPQPNQQQYGMETLPFQKAQVIQLYPNIQKTLMINMKDLSKYITIKNEAKVVGKFMLQYKSVVRFSQVGYSVFSKSEKQDSIKHQNFVLYDGSQTQESTIFKLNFLSEFKFSHIQNILIHLKSEKFSVISLALINSEISYQVDLTQFSDSDSGSFGMVPIWLPFSYDSQNDKVKQMIQYVYFRAGQIATKLRINRIKGHPKIFLYNCQTDRIEFCKSEIVAEHVEGTLMFQKEIQVSFTKQPNCKDCLIILAFKNMGAETNVQITQHSAHDSLMISKDVPIFYDMKRNSSLQITSYYNLQKVSNRNQLFLDFSFVEGNASSIKLENIAINILGDSTRAQSLTSDDFLLENRTNAIRIKLSSNFKGNVQTKMEESFDQFWFKIMVKITSRAHTYFSIVDRNVPVGDQNFISLKDGEIFHSYIFDDIDEKVSEEGTESSKKAFQVENFKVKVPSISTMTIITSCTEFNRLQIEFYGDPTKTTRINPKIYVQNITNHKKKCSQLIHFKPTLLFSKTENKQAKQRKSIVTTMNEKGGWVYVKLTGIKDEVDLLYSSSDMIILEKAFPFHSQLQYNQPFYFYIPNIKNQTRIKITKCSDCHLTLSYSHQQLADLKTKRTQEIITKELIGIQNQYIDQMKESHGLYIKLNTNNYAHFVLTVEQVSQESNELGVPSDTNRRVAFFIEDDNKLLIEFSPPEFIYTNNLNSPIHFTLIEGSINVQVSRQVYCPEFIFTEKQKTRDVSITPIFPQLTHDESGNEKMRFIMELKHHDFFGIRAQKGSEIFSYKVVNIESLKEFAEYRLSIFNVVLFLTFALFMSFVCFMGLKRKRVKKIGGEVVLEETDGEQTSMIRLN